MAEKTRITTRIKAAEKTEQADIKKCARGLLGDSKQIKNIHALIRQVAVYDTSVLITGESGTGKELVAQAIHAHSDRRNKPFVPINCGAIPADLLESELFGHEKARLPVR